MDTHSIHTYSMPELSGARMDRSHTWERNEAWHADLEDPNL